MLSLLLIYSRRGRHLRSKKEKQNCFEENKKLKKEKVSLCLAFPLSTIADVYNQTWLKNRSGAKQLGSRHSVKQNLMHRTEVCSKKSQMSVFISPSVPFLCDCFHIRLFLGGVYCQLKTHRTSLLAPPFQGAIRDFVSSFLSQTAPQAEYDYPSLCSCFCIDQW